MAERLRQSREFMKGAVTCIKNIRLVLGDDEAARIEEENSLLHKRGLPLYVRTARSVGANAYIWTQSSTTLKDFITDVELSHKNPRHEKHKKPAQMNGWELVSHPLMDLQLWVKRDTLKVIAFSYQTKFS